MMPSLIPADDTWSLWAIMLVGVAVSIYLERTYRWAAKLSGPVLGLLIAMTLSNLHVVPSQSPAYDVVWDYLVPTAIPLLLFRADIFRIARTAGTMFLVFHISVLGSLLGSVLAAFALRRWIDSPAQLAGIMAASYSGGSVNFFAVKDSFHVSENLTGPLLVADNFIMAGMFIVLLLIAGSRWFRRHYPHPHSGEDAVDPAQAAAEHWRPKEIALLDIAAALGIAFAIAAVSQKLSGLVQSSVGNELIASMIGNPYVVITTVTVILATLFARQFERIRGSEELGSYLLYVFLFAIGLPADLIEVIKNVPLMFVFCLIIALTNLAVTLAAGKLWRLNLEELLLCVNATLGGAPSAAAMAVASGWPKLVLPAVLVAVWGYAIGTILGLLVGEGLLRLL
jgi:uncharacterized membrane protein